MKTLYKAKWTLLPFDSHSACVSSPIPTSTMISRLPEKISLLSEQSHVHVGPCSSQSHGASTTARLPTSCSEAVTAATAATAATAPPQLKVHDSPSVLHRAATESRNRTFTARERPMEAVAASESLTERSQLARAMHVQPSSVWKATTARAEDVRGIVGRLEAQPAHAI